jgi:hypothetical protein
MVVGNVTLFSVPALVPVQLIVPVPEPVIWILPVEVPHVVGLTTVPNAMTGSAFTTTVVPAELAEVQPPFVTFTV